MITILHVAIVDPPKTRAADLCTGGVYNAKVTPVSIDALGTHRFSIKNCVILMFGPGISVTAHGAFELRLPIPVQYPN